MKVLRGIEVRADTVFKPGVTELFGDVLRLTALRERRLASPCQSWRIEART